MLSELAQGPGLPRPTVQWVSHYSSLGIPTRMVEKQQIPRPSSMFSSGSLFHDWCVETSTPGNLGAS